MIPTEHEFLDFITGYVAEDRESAGTRAPKLGNIASDYVGSSGLPRVRFDGDTVTSPNGFQFIKSYRPQANDRVLMIPVGTSYVIVGPTNSNTNTNTLFQASADLTVATSVTTQPFTLGTVVIADPGVPYRVELFAGLDATSTGTWKLEIRDGSATGTKVAGMQGVGHMVAQGISPTILTGAKTYYAVLVTSDSPVQTLTIVGNLQFYGKIFL